MTRLTYGLLGTALIVLVVAVVLGYTRGLAWVGVNDAGSGTIKTLWDWMELLIVPTALGITALLFNASRMEADRRATADRTEEEALQVYFDRMSQLLLETDLRNAGSHSDLKAIAEARTLTTLRRLNPERQGLVVSFLVETGLIRLRRPEDSEGLIRLAGADLARIELEEAWLALADLGETNLRGAKLRRAVLRKAVLFGADLTGADIRESNLQIARLDNAKLVLADLRGAHLEGAHLEISDFTGADLTGADLTDAEMLGANFTRAKVTQEQLQRAKDLRGITMPDGSKHA